jgi:hypothetical protein
MYAWGTEKAGGQAVTEVGMTGGWKMEMMLVRIGPGSQYRLLYAEHGLELHLI